MSRIIEIQCCHECPWSFLHEDNKHYCGNDEYVSFDMEIKEPFKIHPDCKLKTDHEFYDEMETGGNEETR